MSGPIQVLPRGLLSLLQLKQMGKSPSQLAEVVAPTLDIMEFYRQGLFVDQRNFLPSGSATLLFNARNFNGPFTNGTETLTAPNNETWYVERFSAIGNIPAADTCRIALAIASVPAVTVLPVSEDVTDVLNARNRTFSICARSPFWLPPGWQIGAVVMDVLTGTNISLIASMRAIRIPL